MNLKSDRYLFIRKLLSALIYSFFFMSRSLNLHGKQWMQQMSPNCGKMIGMTTTQTMTLLSNYDSK